MPWEAGLVRGAFEEHVVNALFVSDDRQTAKTLSDVLQRQSIDLMVCTEFAAACKELSRAKYHALFLDCDTAQAKDLLTVIRNSPSNKAAVVLAISSDKTLPRSPGDVRTQAQFVMQKPLARAQVEATLRAARGLLLRELRQYYRHPMDAPITLTAAGKTLQAKVTNISMGGVGIRSSDPEKLSGSVHIRLTLPQGELFESHGDIVWADEHGRSGIHFRDMAPLFQTRLEQWLTSKLEQQHTFEDTTNPQ